ncbi:uncharacterized protein TEOVI_000242900 [Trypanosoma equiperdum]|uniref:Uncharacterized protein n=3 Tax=Trypanozoon TaxID=39700 RepID=D0A7T4_TRYB9|nr:hypothetical protein, conserved [Trypanosoma brucei gambiense DAL972]RHW67138.1 hypothetical protein DPX39_000028800 [Trypanosoma brucei equiperdum]CBH17735.1 hypothetical protein, conserved [Trypanosoma brucei gambiense DAL972]SCU70854.1 hypothetical protein, conserved [Trypanosoma equiperdum]|eukprot:XP_011779999.1 hypothetical protein, conserved [Trypanosoma brucei gambiense DAL972]
MGSDDSELEVLQDPSSYTKSIQKDNGARWVRGLTPIETNDSVKLTTAPSSTRSWVLRCMRHWLLVPVILGVCCLLALTMDMADMWMTHGTTYLERRRHPLDFPLNEDELRGFTALQGESLMHHLSRVRRIWCVSVLSTLFSLAISWRIGIAARDFLALCGVGVSILSLLATGGQWILLWTACDTKPKRGNIECKAPFVLYWCLTVARMGGPLLAVWFTASVFDDVRGYRFFWKIFLALPVFAYVSGAALLANCCKRGGGSPSCDGEHAVYRWCSVATLLSWTQLVVSCWAQHRFNVVLMVKPHNE